MSFLAFATCFLVPLSTITAFELIPLKAFLPTDLSDEQLIVIFLRALSPLKAFLEIFVMPLPIVTVLSDVQFLNAPAPGPFKTSPLGDERNGEAV